MAEIENTGETTTEALHVPDRLRRVIERVLPTRTDNIPAPVRKEGQFLDARFSNAAGTLAYKLYIPARYNGQAVPLLIMLHGCSQNAVDFAVGTHMNRLAEQETWIVAYPEQVHAANRSKCWNWFQPVNQRRDTGEPSLIAGITRQIMHTYHIDARRVYVAGMSAGGAMAVIMAVTYPDLYAAVGVHSGLPYNAAHSVSSAFMTMRHGSARRAPHLTNGIPLIIFHGDRDTTVAAVNADHLLEQWLPPGSSRNAVVETGHVIGGHPYTRSLYRDARGYASVEQWIVHYAGHAWSGGGPTGSFTDPQGPDASSHMLRFFNEHPRQ